MNEKSKNEMITVIVPVYNVERYLHKCIDSLINQTYTDLEVLLIDDGSTDGSPAICDEYEKKDNRIRVFHKKNEGQAAARNLGLSVASGEYIGFVDSDDWIEPTMYEELINAIVDCDIAVCGRYNVDEDTGIRTQAFCCDEPIVMDQIEAIRRFLLTDFMDGAGCDKLIRKELLKDVRFPQGFICEDLPFVYDLLIKVEKVVHIGKPLYNYLQRKGSTSHSSFTTKTYGLVKYPLEISTNVVSIYPGLHSEAELFYKSRLYWFLKMYYDSKSKEPIGITYHVNDFKVLSMHERLVVLSMKLGIYRAIKNMLGK